MSTFKISSGLADQSKITVSVAEGIEIEEAALLKFKAFADWRKALLDNLASQSSPDHTFSSDPWLLHEIKVHDVFKFRSARTGAVTVGFMTVEAIMRKSSAPNEPTNLDRVVFLRGGSVAVLMILRPKDARDERYVIMTEQPRIGACGMKFLEIPAGMMDDEHNVKSKAIQEIEEETGFKIQPNELINMTELALEQTESRENLQLAMYPSPGNLDESISLLLWEKELDRHQIEELRGRLTGDRDGSDELITLRVRDYDVLWKEGARDAKTLGAWALYEGLNRSGKILEKLQDIRAGKFEMPNVN